MSLFSFLNNPITLAAAAVIAIGIFAYEIINHQTEGRVPAGRGGGGQPRGGGGPPRGGGGPPSGGGGPPRGGGGPPRPPRGDRRSSDTNPKGLDDSSTCVTIRSNTEHQVRNRKREESKPCTKNKQDSRVNCKASSSSKENTEFDEKEYYKNVFDKIENDLRNVNQNNEVKKDFDKNIEDEEPGPSGNSNRENSNETKLINTRISDSNLPVSTNQNIRGSSGGESNSEETNETSSNQNLAGATAMDIQNHTVPQNDKCMACEEGLANSVAYPCQHCYLCADCAVMVHRIYKKCTICESVVEYFQTS